METYTMSVETFTMSRENVPCIGSLFRVLRAS
jgi:hypothetical protein